jgi:hypothetical protein
VLLLEMGPNIRLIDGSKRETAVRKDWDGVKRREETGFTGLKLYTM